MFSLYGSRKTAIISLHSIDRLAFITEHERVYCAVRVVSLKVIQINLSLLKVNTKCHEHFFSGNNVVTRHILLPQCTFPRKITLLLKVQSNIRLTYKFTPKQAEQRSCTLHGLDEVLMI